MTHVGVRWDQVGGGIRWEVTCVGVRWDQVGGDMCWCEVGSGGR